MGTFGPVTVHVPRARLETSDGKTGEWKANDDGKLIMPPKILTAFKAAGEPITSAAALATALAAFEAAAMLITPQSVSA